MRLLLQAIFNEEDFFKEWGLDFLQILGPTEGPFYRGFIPHLCTGLQYRDTIATILSGPDRAPNYPVDGSVYASLTCKMAGFLIDPYVFHLSLFGVLIRFLTAVEVNAGKTRGERNFSWN